MGSNKKCKKCGASQLASSRYQGIERIVSTVLPVVPLRCRDCFQRGMYSDGLLANKVRASIWGGALLLFGLTLGSGFIANSTTSNQTINDRQSVQPKSIKSSIDSSAATFSGDLGVADKSVDDEVMSGLLVDDGRQMATYSAQPLVSKVVVDKTNELEPSAQKQEPSALGQQLPAVKKEPSVLKNELSVQGDRFVELEKERIEKQIKSLIENWRVAWQGSNAEGYLGFYTDTFSPEGGLTYSEWLANRQRIVSKREDRNIEINRIRVVLNRDLMAAGVEFKQNYSSATISDEVLKRMYLKKVGGDWKIARESVFSLGESG